MALDGTKSKANALKQKAMRNGRRQKTEANRATTGQEWRRKVEPLDAREEVGRGCCADSPLWRKCGAWRAYLATF